MNKTAHAVRSLLKSNAAFDVSHISYCASDATALAMRCYFNADQMSAPHMYLMLRRVCVCVGCVCMSVLSTMRLSLKCTTMFKIYPSIRYEVFTLQSVDFNSVKPAKHCSSIFGEISSSVICYGPRLTV